MVLDARWRGSDRGWCGRTALGERRVSAVAHYVHRTSERGGCEAELETHRERKALQRGRDVQQLVRASRTRSGGAASGVCHTGALQRRYLSVNIMRALGLRGVDGSRARRDGQRVWGRDASHTAEVRKYSNQERRSGTRTHLIQDTVRGGDTPRECAVGG